MIGRAWLRLLSVSVSVSVLHRCHIDSDEAYGKKG
jgi:hypothetical protein